jgi:hypothetical protein
MKRYSIKVRQHGLDYETELCQCDSNPEAIVEGAQQKKIKWGAGGRKIYVAKYEHVYFVDHEAPSE